MVKYQLGDGPVEPEYLEAMTKLARGIDQLFNENPVEKKVGFILMLFNFGGDGRCNYMSNANRDDVVTMLKEQLARFEGQPDLRGTA